MARAIGRRSRTFRQTAVLVPTVILAVIVVACLLGPTLFGLPAPATGNLSDHLLPLGSPHHLLGTNVLGNDMVSQLLAGGRISLAIGVGATALGLVFGVAIGMTAGYYQGVIGATLMRLVDVIYAFPSIILALAIAAYLDPSVLHTTWAIGFFSIAGFARVARAQTLRLRSLDYIVAARAGGSSPWRIMIGHIWPNISGTVMTYSLVGVGHAIIAEATLSFLGLGVPVPTPSWGNIIAAAQSFMSQAPRLIVMPTLLLLTTIVCVNLLADALRARRAA
jgi:peptide/nickel transport system permease protein